ncbi:MAG: hypothetical protein AAFR96_00585 [Planctomycetota bacterium]
MVLNLIAIALTFGIAYAWVTRGFFSAFLHMVCVLIAGAVAFGFWEVTSLAIVDNAPSGFLAIAGDAAWGLGLIGPFVLSLVLLRLIVDSLVKGNAQVDDSMNYVGGAVCGLVSGVLSAGIFINAVSFMRVPSAFFGHQPVTYGVSGNLQKSSNLWIPVDAIAASFYGHLSTNVASTGTPLATYYPDLPVAAGTQRMSDGEGDNRNSIPTDAVALTSSFTVGKAGGSAADVLSGFNAPSTQQVSGLDGNPVPNPYIVGYVVNFTAGARESTGQIVLSKGQARLVTRDETSGELLTSFPIAVSAQAAAGEDTFGRYRFETEGTHIASVGGAAEAPMAIEFAVPRGHEPVSLYVKNVRLDISNVESRDYANASGRDIDIRSGNLLGGTRAENLDTTNALIAETPRQGNPAGIVINARLPRGFQLQKGNTRGIEINDENEITTGTQAFALSEVGIRGVTRELIVSDFASTLDTAVVQVTMTGDPNQIPSSVFGPAAAAFQNSEQPRLIDANGRIYPAIGYIYKDREKAEIRYSPSDPLGSMSDAPGLSNTRDDQEMIMVFGVSDGVQIQHLAIGDVVLVTYEPAVTANRR